MAPAPDTSSQDADLATAASFQPPPQLPLWRRVLPFAIAIALLSFVLARLDLAAFLAVLRELDVPLFLGFTAVWTVVLLAADALASVAAYRVSAPGVRFVHFFVLRGASYMMAIVNHHLGQAFLTYMTSRAFGVPIARVAGATLLSYAAWMGCFLGLAAVAMPLAGMPALWLLAPLGAGVVYLIVLHVRPQRLARFSLLAPLFEAGIRGHAIALAARIPHLAVLVVGTWIPFFFFDVRIPVGTALLLMPIVLIAVTLPITPAGFGTRDALSVAFFSTYAAGATDAERAARIAACTTSWGVAATLTTAVLGLLCTRFAARLVERRAQPAVAAPAPSS